MKVEELGNIAEFMARHPARLEVLLSELIKRNWLSEDEIELELVSTFSRNWAKDVQEARVIERRQGAVLHLRANREGLFDQLPPNFFHQPDRHQPGQKLNQRLDDAKLAREEEAETRKFFYPFEQMLFRFRMRVENNESRLADGFQSPLRRELLLNLWPSCRAIDESFYPLLSYVLPLSYRVAGDLDLMGICYSTVLRLPARFERIYPGQKAEQTLNQRAGRLLGQDFELSGRPATDLPILELTLGPTDRATAHHYLPGGKYRSLLDILNDCLVPFEYDLKLSFAFKPGADEFRLGDRDLTAPALGSHTRLFQTATR